MSERAHGTHARYVLGAGPGYTGGCRCDPCRQANRDYERARAARKDPPYVSAGPAREHIAWLGEHNVGLKTVAKLAGVSHGSLWKLVYGKPARGPSKRIRPAASNAILAVRPNQGAAGSRIPAGPTWVLIDALTAAGIPRVRIAERIGQSRSLQLSRSFVMRGHAAAIKAMHDEMLAGTLAVERGMGRHASRAIEMPAAAPRRDPRSIDARADADDIEAFMIAMAEAVEARNEQVSWRRHRACRDAPSWMFFPSRGDHKTLEAAKKVCVGCAVREQCLAANLDERDGVYGGLSGFERRGLRTQRRLGMAS